MSWPNRWPRPRWTARSSSCTRTARERRKRGLQAIGRSRGGWKTKLHLLACDDRGALAPGQAHDAPTGRALLRRHSRREGGLALLMDRACEDDATRGLARLGARRAAEAQPARALGLRPRALQAP